MSILKKVIEIQKQLNKTTNNNILSGKDQINLLKELENLKINLKILKKTGIGKTVNTLRKASKEAEVIKSCKKLVKEWKKLLDNDDQESASTSKGNSSLTSPKIQNEKKSKETTKQKVTSASTASDFTESVASTETIDSVRLKCREMLAKALKPDSEDDNCKSCMSAKDLEEAIFNEFKGTDTKYKNRVRSIISNLKDPKNALKTKCRIGTLTAERLAKMTSADMANDEVRQLKEKYNQEAINRAQLATRGQGTKTDMFKCDKCQKRNCTYMQLQTLASDEPMTTFVCCNECGNRWMFC